MKASVRGFMKLAHKALHFAHPECRHAQAVSPAFQRNGQQWRPLLGSQMTDIHTHTPQSLVLVSRPAISQHRICLHMRTSSFRQNLVAISWFPCKLPDRCGIISISRSQTATHTCSINGVCLFALGAEERRKLINCRVTRGSFS